MLKYISTIILTVMELIVVLIILSAISYSSDSQVLAGLLMLYSILRLAGIRESYDMNKIVLALSVEFIRTREHIRKDDDTQGEWDKYNIARDAVETTTTKLIIREVGVWIIFIMGIVNFMS